MRSSAVFLAALVGVASAGMPKWPREWSGTGTGVSGGGVGPTGTGRLPLGPGPVIFPTGYPSGGIYPSGGSKYTHNPTGSGVGPTGTGVGPTGTGHGGPTGTGHGGSPPPPTSAHTTTITKTSDVASE